MHFRKLLGVSSQFKEFEVRTLNIDRDNNIVLFAISEANKSSIIYYDRKSSTTEYISVEENVNPEEVLFIQLIGVKDWVLIVRRDEEEQDFAVILNDKGKVRQKFVVGAGIAHCQVDKDDNIWISYFDEGVFGDFAIGENGIVAFNVEGEVVFNQYDEFVEKYNVPPIDDCYAMNVVDGEVWLCYHSECPLVQLKDKKFHQLWEVEEYVGRPIGFALRGNDVLFVTTDNELVSYSLLTNETHYFSVVNEHNEEICFNHCFGRGSVLYVQTDDSLYYLDLTRTE
jgi:hypothetical protein